MKKRLLSFCILFVALFLCKVQAQPSGMGESVKSSLSTSFVYPLRVVWKHAGDSASIKGDNYLLQTNTGQSVLNNHNVCVLRSTTSSKASILLDFGRELQGGIEIITGNMNVNQPVKVHVCFGESVSEAMSTVGEHGVTNDHALRDFDAQLPWLGSTQLGNTGFRFVRIDLLDVDREVIIKEIRAVFQYRDIPYIGSFRCNDERLNSIWQTGAYTVHLNMQNYLWDGVKRDRLVWVGDLHPEVMTVAAVFGDNEVVTKSLDISKQSNPLPGWMNGISSYSMWWVLIHRDWYYHQGDLAYLQAQKEYLYPLLKQLLKYVDDEGYETLDGNRFLDWPSSTNKQGIDAGLQALLLMTFEAGAQLCTLLDEPSIAADCQAAVRRMKKVKMPHNNSKQAVALQALAGVMPADTAAVLLMDKGVKGFSTFYGYYMLQAMAKAGRYAEAIDIIREYWGTMLDLGATTFWEDFDIDWAKNAGRIDELPIDGQIDLHKTYGDYCYKGYRHSLCHGWASGPTTWLSEHVLGVEIMEAGCKAIRITPHLGDLQWVEGTFPTPHGTIFIRHDKQPDGKIKTIIEKPKAIRLVK